MSTADADVAALDKVLGRLALTEEDKLEKVLVKLLPLVIDQLKSPAAAARNKVMEILTHLNKRIRDQKHIKLPLKELLDLYTRPDAAPMARNFALVYVEMAFERADASQRGSVVGHLMSNISKKTNQHRDMLLRMAFWGLEGHVTPSGYTLEKEAAVAKEKYQFVKSEEDLKVFLDYALKMLLYIPASYITKPAPKAEMGAPLAAAAAVLAGQRPPAAEEPPPQPPLPPGLSKADVAWVEGKAPLSVDALASRKLGILNFLVTCDLGPKEIIRHLLVAACDFKDEVSRRGEELLRKRCGVDANKPSVDLEDPELISSLFSLFSGNAGIAPEEQQVQMAGPAVRLRLMGLFCKSIKAANSFPFTLEVIFTSVAGDASTQRLKSAGMEFAVWVFKHADEEQLRPVDSHILKALLSQLDEVQGQQDSASSMLRGFTYQAIGQLAQRSSTIFQAEISIAQRLFAALSTEPPGTRATLQEAVSTLAVAYKGSTGETEQAIQELLLESMKSPKEPTRLCAVQWAAKLYPFSSVPARYICMLAAGDHKLEIREEGARGLKPPPPPKATTVGAETPEIPDSDRLPDAVAMLTYMASRHPALEKAVEPARPLLLPAQAFLAALRFMKQCWSAHEGDRPESDKEAYLRLLEAALVKEGTADLHEAAMEALLHAAFNSQAFHAEWLAGRLTWLQGFLSHTSGAVRDAAGKLMGIAAIGLMDSLSAEKLIVQLVEVIGNGSADKKPKFEEIDGSLAALGYVLAQVGSTPDAGGPMAAKEHVASACAVLCKFLFDKDLSLASAAAKALGHAGLRAPLPLPLASGEESKETDVSALAALTPSQKVVVYRILELMKERDMKVVIRSTHAAGYICAGACEAEVIHALVEGLLALSTNKTEEVQFAVGDALAFAFGGVSISADEVLRSNFESLAVSNKFFAGTEDTDMLDADGHALEAATPASSARDAAQEAIVNKIMQEYIYHSRSEVRCAACIWLLSLVAFTRRHPRLMAMLTDIQEAFSTLLGDSNELTQDMASRGMSVVYAVGDAGAREKLVAGLVGTLQGGPKKRRAVKLTSDTQVFEEGAMGEAPGGGSLSTYKELCAMATDLGQPDLVYKFMDLANHQAALTSRRGAAFGFASIAKLAGEQLAPHVSALVPKLYRYQYDPNPRVSEAMSHIWHALVPEPKKAVDASFDQICTELLREMGGRLWRNREACCAGMADLLQGRRWDEVSSRFEEIWVMGLRAMDDIKESVRQAAAKLIRTLRGLTLRLCDPAHTPKADAAAATGTVIPLLLSTKGVGSDAAEIRALGVDTIAKICKTAGHEQIQPHIPDLAVVMLESLTQLEDQRLNYVEQHAERIGINSDKLENVRVAASKSTPMGDTLDMCARQCSSETLEKLVPRLVQLIKRGVGLNTRCGTANFVVQLSMRHGGDMKSHTGTLIKALLSAAKSERSMAVRRAYTSTAAQIARFASEARVAKLLDEAVTMFNEAEGGDRDARLLAGMIVREMAKQAPDLLSRNAASVMPLAYTARMDEDPDVAALWKEVWEEGTSSEAAAIRLYISELAPIMSQGLASQQWGRKVAAAKSIASAAESAADALAPHAASLAAAVMAELPGRLWDGKQALLEALGALAKGCPKEMDESKVLDALLVAAARKKVAFHTAALLALEKTITAFSSDNYERVAPALLEACKLHSELPPKKKAQESGGEADEDAPLVLPLIESVQCLGAAWSRAAAGTVAAEGGSLSAALAGCLASHNAWPVRTAALAATQSFVGRLVELNGDGNADGDGDSTMRGAALPVHQIAWLNPMVSGVLDCTEDGKISQLRTAAMKCLAQILKASEGGSLLASETREAADRRLQEMMAGEKNSVVKAEVAKTAKMISKLDT